MKNQLSIYTKLSTLLTLVVCLSFLILLSGCNPDDPEKEDVPELITKVALTFVPTGGGMPVIVSATDPDGEGIQDISVDGPINLSANKTYMLSLELINGIAKPTDAAYDITKEVEEEGDEHMFFFSWTNNVFSDPAGDGNIDNRSDAVNYNGAVNSKDMNGLPLGLTTTWICASGISTGNFRVLLKHQPGLKSSTSNSSVGETDLDLNFTVNIQ